ncbi:hypothetical protein AB1Y20_005277 [Prymnesium parvum]|uniref:ShKT domain-containing protein n=1 Tax=Prymnesium parvum TaxID=97485 RepID=A0AB34J6S0_PRYPA
MEYALLALAPVLFAARALLCLSQELRLASPADDDPAACAQLASSGASLLNASHMLSHCAHTLATSFTLAGLVDVHDAAECERWPAGQHCSTNPAFMIASCNASCGALLLRRVVSSRRQRTLAMRLGLPPEWLHDSDAHECSGTTASECLSQPERYMRLCPSTCLGLAAADNTSAHSCQQWAQRGECAKNHLFMSSACASTCSEYVYREQMRLQLSRNSLAARKHVGDCLAAAALLLAAGGIRALWRWLCPTARLSWRPAPSCVPALPCALVTCYFFVDGVCSLQSRIAYWEWLNPDWRQGRTELQGVDLRTATSALVLPLVCVLWLRHRHAAVLTAVCMSVLAVHLVAITIVDVSHHYVQYLAVRGMERGGEAVVYSAAQLRQKDLRNLAEAEFAVKRVSLIGCLVAFLAAHAEHINRVFDGLPRRSTPEPQAVAIFAGRILIGAPLVATGAGELYELILSSEQLPFPRGDSHNVLWPKVGMLLLCLPLMLGLGPFRLFARVLAVLSMLEAVLLWTAPEAWVVTWLEASDNNTLSFKEAFNDVHHHRRHFGLMLGLSGGFALLHTVGAGGYTLGDLLKKRS